MTDFGRIKVEEAKKNGMWDAPKKAKNFRRGQKKFLQN